MINFNESAYDKRRRQETEWNRILGETDPRRLRCRDCATCGECRYSTCGELEAAFKKQNKSALGIEFRAKCKMAAAKNPDFYF